MTHKWKCCIFRDLLRMCARQKFTSSVTQQKSAWSSWWRNPSPPSLPLYIVSEMLYTAGDPSLSGQCSVLRKKSREKHTWGRVKNTHRCYYTANYLSHSYEVHQCLCSNTDVPWVKYLNSNSRTESQYHTGHFIKNTTLIQSRPQRYWDSSSFLMFDVNINWSSWHASSWLYSLHSCQ